MISNREGTIPSLNHLSCYTHNLVVAFHSAALLVINSGHTPAASKRIIPFIDVKNT